MSEAQRCQIHPEKEDDEEHVITCRRCFQLFSVPHSVFQSRDLDLCVGCFRFSPALILPSSDGPRVKPIVFKPDHIDGKIYLGGYRCAMVRSTLDDLNITNVMVCGNDLIQYFAAASRTDDATISSSENVVLAMGETISGAARPLTVPPIEYLQFSLEDEYDQQISHCFDLAHDFINNSKGNVLIHCHAGVSRSATIVVSYLMKHKGMTFEEARNFAKSKRRCVCPNPGFVKQLQDYQRQLEENGILPRTTTI